MIMAKLFMPLNKKVPVTSYFDPSCFLMKATRPRDLLEEHQSRITIALQQVQPAFIVDSSNTT